MFAANRRVRESRDALILQSQHDLDVESFQPRAIYSLGAKAKTDDVDVRRRDQLQERLASINLAR
jgi:hypothetical protein